MNPLENPTKSRHTLHQPYIVLSIFTTMKVYGVGYVGYVEL